MVREFYDYSFPDDERMPYDRLLSMVDDNHVMYAWYDEDKLIGMTFTFVFDHLAYLSYQRNSVKPLASAMGI